MSARPELLDNDGEGRQHGPALAFLIEARVIAQRHGGVVYADGVGTGKTDSAQPTPSEPR